MKTLPALAALTLLFATAAPAHADVGFEGSSRKVGSPGDRVELTIGCGFCFPPCVGGPGHRHPPGDPNGTCMLGHRDGPPASFLVWMTPVKHSLDPYLCGPRESPDQGPRGPCRSGSRPPHLPTFIYLGRAVPPRPDDPADRPGHYFPRYKLTFEVPEARPGRYKYVLFCDTCIDGPRGSIVDDRAGAAGPLRVLPATATASDGDSGVGALPWVGAGVLVVALAIGAVLLLRRSRRTGPQVGPAA